MTEDHLTPQAQARLQMSGSTIGAVVCETYSITSTGVVECLDSAGRLIAEQELARVCGFTNQVGLAVNGNLAMCRTWATNNVPSDHPRMRYNRNQASDFVGSRVRYGGSWAAYNAHVNDR